jgi:hypothetical protein
VCDAGKEAFSIMSGGLYMWKGEGKSWRRWSEAEHGGNVGREVLIRIGENGWQAEKIERVGVDFFEVERLAGRWMWKDGGKSWAWPTMVTHGKHGVPELPAVRPLDVYAKELAGVEFPAKPGAAPRTCRGVPIYQGPDEACDAILGAEVEGDRCVACAEWMRAHGRCDGCNGRLPGWQVTGELCADCRAVRQDEIREQAEQPNDKRKPVTEVMAVAYEEFYEALWEALAEDSDLDPRTVAACKMVRDDERRVRR